MSGAITANRKRKRLERTLDLIQVLQTKHPIAFPPKHSHPVLPLSTTVANDMLTSLAAQDAQVSRYEVDRVLEYWEGRKFYLKAFEQATHRIDLEGRPAEALSDADRERALSRKLSIVAQRQLNE